MQVTVYHHLIASVEMEKGIIYPVAHFQDVPNYNGVFEATNTTWESWVRSRDEGIMIMLRSTSVGDLYKITNQRGGNPVWFKVAPMGFEAMTDEEVNAAFIVTATATAEMIERANAVPGFRQQMFD